jgi:hypothetical protein
MEANSGGGPLGGVGGVGVSLGNGAGAPTVAQLLHHGWQTQQQPFFNEFSNQQPPGKPGSCIFLPTVKDKKRLQFELLLQKITSSSPEGVTANLYIINNFCNNSNSKCYKWQLLEIITGSKLPDNKGPTWELW